MSKRPLRQQTPDKAADEISGADAEVFRAAVRDVRPLPANAAATVAPRAKPRPRRRVSAAGASDVPAVTHEPQVEAEATLTFRRPGVQESVMRRLRRGQFGIEAKLDLHGEHLGAARAALTEFLSECAAYGFRAVLIVHGKGKRSGHAGPVLKSAVNGWLRREPPVLAFVSARLVHGGSGALYVLLRA
jgi:DNA-nicking Smr family endonuclease